MKKVVAATIFVFFLGFGLAAAQTLKEHPKRVGEGASNFSMLIGKTVKNIQGDDLGTITEFVKGPKGRIAFAILNFRATDNARKIIAIPIGALSCSEQSCVLNASRESVRATPYFVSKDELAHGATAADIYLSFGVQPYWSEEGSSGKK